MRITLCDLCMDKIEENDIRKVSITKGEREQPVHPALEICVLCAEKVHDLIMDTEFKPCKP